MTTVLNLMVLTEGMVPYTNRDSECRLKDLWERFEKEQLKTMELLEELAFPLDNRYTYFLNTII